MSQSPVDAEDPQERQQLNDMMNAIVLLINGASASGHTKVSIQAALSIMLCQFYVSIKCDGAGKEDLLRLVGIDYENVEEARAEKENHVSDAR